MPWTGRIARAAPIPNRSTQNLCVLATNYPVLGSQEPYVVLSLSTTQNLDISLIVVLIRRGHPLFGGKVDISVFIKASVWQLDDLVNSDAAVYFAEAINFGVVIQLRRSCAPG